MRLFKRRQVIYDWDKNFAPTTHYTETHDLTTPFDWHCPDDAYVQFVALHFKFFAADVIRADSLLSELWHANHRYFQDVMMGTIAKGHTFYLTCGTGLPMWTTALPELGYHTPLPKPLLFVPGHYIRIKSTNPQVGDLMSDVVAYYHRYNLR